MLLPLYVIPSQLDIRKSCAAWRIKPSAKETKHQQWQIGHLPWKPRDEDRNCRGIYEYMLVRVMRNAGRRLLP